MKTDTPQGPAGTGLQLQTLSQQTRALHAQGRYEEALETCLQITHADPDDTLAHAYGQPGQRDEVRRCGLQALNIRDCLFGGKPVIPLAEPEPIPPLPSVQTRERSVIAFSPSGGDSRYCETANSPARKSHSEIF